MNEISCPREKSALIRLVEQSHLPARRTLEKLGILRSTFNRRHDRFLTVGVDALEDRKRRPVGSGTAFPKRCATRSSTLPSTGRTVAP